MRKSKKKLAIIALSIISLIVSCKKDIPEPTNDIKSANGCQLITVQKTTGNKETSIYEYDMNGKLTKHFELDSNGNNPRGCRTFAYNSIGQLIAVIFCNPNSSTSIIYEHNGSKLSKKINISGEDSTTINYKYEGENIVETSTYFTPTNFSKTIYSDFNNGKPYTMTLYISYDNTLLITAIYNYEYDANMNRIKSTYTRFSNGIAQLPIVEYEKIFSTTILNFDNIAHNYEEISNDMDKNHTISYKKYNSDFSCSHIPIDTLFYTSTFTNMKTNSSGCLISTDIYGTNSCENKSSIQSFILTYK